MALSKKPVNGMKDILPAEMEIRDYVTSVIKDTYRSFGFTPIETPCMENIANLTSKQGGENEKLIFKVMKRGEKLNLETAKEESDVVDFGMRYDLTVPLSRYYSNNANNLPSPFKALQMGNVWRADRPQRGRYRQFTQCDIDILGEPSNLAEIELITATTTTIGRLGFENFEIRINERRILKAMAAYSGFAEEDYDSVFITLDKMDKIGVEGVASELAQDGYPQENIDKYLDLFKLLEQTRDVTEGVNILSEKLGEYLDEEVVTNMTEIATAVNATKGAKFELVFDPTLVRGMSYYTGTIFEISMPELGAACGGGGRYDNLTGVFGMDGVSGVGISFGADRIFDVLNQLDLYPADSLKTTQLLFVNFGEKEESYLLPIIARVRAAGIRTELFPESAKMKKQMGYADTKKIPYVAIVGETEMSEGKINLKNMITGEQTPVTVEELIAKF